MRKCNNDIEHGEDTITDEEDLIDGLTLLSRCLSSCLLAIGTIAQHHSAAFMPYMQLVLEYIEMLSCSSVSLIRTRVCGVYYQFVETIFDGYPVVESTTASDALTPLHSEVIKIVQLAFENCLAAMVDDP